jgi:hypothetical protein
MDPARLADDIGRVFRALGDLDHDPFVDRRHVAGKTTYDALGDEAQRRWVHALTQARIVRDLDLDLRDTVEAKEGVYEGDPPRKVSWREAWRGLVTSPGEAWVRPIVERAPAVGAALRERAARRAEVTRRLGASAYGVKESATAAKKLLDATEDIAAYVRGKEAGLVAFVRASLAREATEGWPAQLSPRWLEALFGPGTDGLRLELPALPAAAGAASFARALGEFGFAFRVATSRALPFPLARDPDFTAAHRWASVFAALPLSPHFHRRALGVSRRVADAQARLLARSALLSTRLQAARTVLGADPARELFEEMTARLTGAPLDRQLAGAWPRYRDDEAARTLGLTSALPLARDLVERFDVDWFMNPRALPHLRAMGGGPAFEPAEELDPLPLARAFEEAIG